MLHHLVLVADRIATHSDATIRSRDLECAEETYFDSLVCLLEELSHGITHYSSPQLLVDNAGRHKDDIVISIWSGMSSRNRRALVPSICEAYGIRYVGADAYTHIVCQDKYIAKSLARNAGFETPPAVLISNEQECEAIHLLNYPVVVKPNLEGGSIGISEKNKCVDATSARALTLELLSLFGQPILVEEFVPGAEALICVAGNSSQLHLFEAMEIYLTETPDWFRDNLFGFEIKKKQSVGKSYRPLDADLPAKLFDCARTLFRSLGKVGIMRIDGRLTDKGFEVIELSPDVHLGVDSDFAAACTQARVPYAQLMQLLIEDAAHIEP